MIGGYNGVVVKKIYDWTITVNIPGALLIFLEKNCD